MTESKKLIEGTNYRDCYKAIYNWHKKNGEVQVSHFEYPFLVFGRKKFYEGAPDSPDVRAYLDLLKQLPPPNIASLECIAFIFNQVIMDLFEWASVALDEHGISLMEYAKEGMILLSIENVCYAPHVLYSGVNEEWDKCKLSSTFRRDNRSKYYPIPLFKCRDCGKDKEVGNIYNDNILIKAHVCFTCAWDKKAYKKHGIFSWKCIYK